MKQCVLNRYKGKPVSQKLNVMMWSLTLVVLASLSMTAADNGGNTRGMLHGETTTTLTPSNQTPSASETSKPSASASETSKPSASVGETSNKSVSDDTTKQRDETTQETWETNTGRNTQSSSPSTCDSCVVESTPSVTENTTSITNNCNQVLNSFNNSSECVEKEINKEEPETYFYMSKDLADEIKHALSFVGFGLCVIGLVTNSLNIAVFLMQPKSSTNCYLITIAALGIVSSVALLVSDAYVFVNGTAAYKKLFYVAFNQITVTLYVKPVTQRGLYLIVLLVSIERFLVVTFPLMAKEFLFSRFPKTIIILALSVVAVFHIFSPLKAGIAESVDTTTNATIYSFSASEIQRRDREAIVGASLASKIIFVYFVLIAGLLTNLLIVCALKRHSNTAKKMRTTTDTDKATRQERRITVTIITSSLVMLLLALPLNTGSVLRTLLPHLFADWDAPYRYLHAAIYALSTALVTLSLSTDFLTYMILSSGFRRTCFKLLHIDKTSGTQSDHSNGQTQVSSLDTKM